MMVNTDYDVMVIGGGAAGENAAAYAAKGDLKVALIESFLLGGECSYWACMPSKGLLRPGEALDEASRVPGASAAVTGSVDLETAFDRRDKLSSNWDDSSQEEWLGEVGVDLIRGRGRLAGERIVEVEPEKGDVLRYRANKAVVVATGTSAAHPPIQGLDEILTWDNRDITVLSRVPERLLIVGGGVVGVEMAQAWKTLGAKEVTILELSPRLVDGEEPFVGAALNESLGRLGVRIYMSAETNRISRVGRDGEVSAQVTLEDGTSIELKADEILLATGRKPNTNDLGFETVGLEASESVEVDDRLLAKGVADDWLYAVGDVNGRSLLTHTGKYQGRVVGDRLNGADVTAWGDRKATPRVIFTTPEVAAVGLTEAQAIEEGLDIRAVRYDIGKTAAAGIMGKGYDGICQLVIEAEREVIVGATFVGPRVGEMLHAATIAIVGEVPIDVLWHAIPSFPTLSEVWLRLLETYRDDLR